MQIKLEGPAKCGKTYLMKKIAPFLNIVGFTVIKVDPKEHIIYCEKPQRKIKPRTNPKTNPDKKT